MREFVRASSGFEVPKLTVFRLVLEVWLRFVEPQLRHEISNSAVRPIYSSAAGRGYVLFM